MFSRNDVRYLHFTDLEKEFNAFKSGLYSCPAILVYCSVRYWTWFCYLIGIALHTLSDSLRIFFSTLEIGLKKNPKFTAKFSG